MKVITWLFTPRKVRQLKKQQDCPFKMKSETEAIKSACIDQIVQDTKPLYLIICALAFRLGIKDIQTFLARINRDHIGRQTMLPNPVFTAIEAAQIRKKYFFFIFSIPLFLIAESFLYFLVSAIFLPGGAVYMKIIVSIFIATVIMVALNYGIEKYVEYQEALDRHNKKEISGAQLRIQKDFKNIGLGMIALSFAAIVLAGLARSAFLEFIPTQNIEPARLESIRQSSRMASLLTMILTILTGAFMGMLKQDHKNISIQFRVLQDWKKALVRRNKYSQELIRNANTILFIVEQHSDKAWQLVIHLKRVFKMEQEFDPQHNHLQQEYLRLKATPGFFVTDDLYAKYGVIQSAHEELFLYGIRHHPQVKEKIAFAVAILSLPEKYLAEHLTASTNPVNSESDISLFSRNGKDRKYTRFTT